MADEVKIDLSEAAAMVLYGLVSRINEDEEISFADQAEERVLWDLESSLEALLAGVLASDYHAALDRARAAVRDPED